MSETDNHKPDEHNLPGLYMLWDASASRRLSCLETPPGYYVRAYTESDYADLMGLLSKVDMKSRDERGCVY
jgi:hypothetical protein